MQVPGRGILPPAAPFPGAPQWHERKGQAVTGTGQAGRRDIARLLLLCAVLAGLFLMHGAPATAAEGCHDAVPAAAMPAPMPVGEDTAAADPLAGGADAAMAHPGSGSAVQTPAPSMAHGAMCVSTLARERLPLPAHGLLTVVAVLAVTVLAGRAVLPARIRRGPPPPGGRSLLLQVSVART